MRTSLHAPRPRRRSIAAATLGALALIGSLLVATPAQALNDTGTGGVFVPASGRILDTAKNIGEYSTPMPAKTWRTVTVAGNAGVPDDGSVGAVSVVATVADITAQGQLFGRPSADEPTTMMGIYGGEDKQNTSFSAVLAVNSDGTIQVQAENAVRLILDVQGYYTANSDGTAPGGFVPLNGKRIVDTRSGLGATKATLASGDRIDVQVTGTADVPAGASGVIVNLIAVNTLDHTGYLTPYPAGDARPSTSLNYAAGVPTSMQAQVELSSAGKITIYNSSSTTNLVVDVQGYFTAAGQGGAVFTPGAGRAYDTRTGSRTPLAKNETRSIQIAGVAGVPVMGSGINAVVLTLTALKSTAGSGNATVWADGTTKPNTTSINFDETTIRTNTITVPLGANGKISLWNNAGSTDYVVDVQGWYANPLAPTISCPSPYAAGAVTRAIPSEAVRCTVTVPAATESGAEVDIDIDGTPSSTVALSEAATTTTSALLPATGGVHQIDATIVTNTYESYGSSSFSTEFGGDWPNDAMKYFPGDGLLGDMSDVLAVVPNNDPLRDYVQRRFTVSTNPDGITNPVLDSGWITDDFQLDASALTEGTRYYWQTQLSGPTSTSSTVQSVTTPVLSFIADAQPVAAECVIAANTTAQAKSIALTKDDVDAACATTNTVDLDSAQTATSDDIASDPGLSGSQKVEMMQAAKSSTIKSVEWQQHDDQLAYSEWQSGKFYYNGSKSWTNKYSGKAGWHRCHVYGSKTVAASVSVINCFEHRAGKKSEQTLSGEDYQVDLVLRGAPVSYVKNMSATCGVTGTVTKKVNKR